jgi:hypothetical protein
MEIPEGLNHDGVHAYLDGQSAERGAHIIMHLIAGPEHWAKMPTLKLSEKAARQARDLLVIIRDRGLGDEAPQSFLASQGYLAHHAVESLLSEMEMWAMENGRDDILKTPVQLINEALPEADRIPE